MLESQSQAQHPEQPGAAHVPDSDTPKPGPTSKKHPILIVVMGVAGTGKTTLARALEARLDMPYVEGDALHPPANIAKMSAGIPLTDADREPWLEVIRTTAEHMAAAQRADPAYARRPGVLVTCSALRGYYRDILRGTRAPPGLQRPDAGADADAERREHLELPAYFVYIKGDKALLQERISKREGHYMKPGMLESQLQTLESPEGEEGVVVVPLDASTEEQAEIAIRELNELLPEPL
ncbi:carbohydrate kinase [Polyporus arcularius HHB13444]|uniref:gluconokinase n=1 Tax=Polyporus arcularius HHB13444 TaxID=1314778 RepID=A0A5C3P8D3_9APHY|nr:carbohydrate kinase [Polyporus arcularius HHB13444]